MLIMLSEHSYALICTITSVQLAFDGAAQITVLSFCLVDILL